MAGIEMFEHDQTVRFVDFGTPSQRQTLWVVEFTNSQHEDWGSARVKVHRLSDRDSIIWAPRNRITGANLLDLIANL